MDDFKKVVLAFLVSFCFLLGWFIGKLILVFLGMLIALSA